MDQTKHHIFPASAGLQSFRDAGYRDTSMAIAELIDNSIQAKAKTIRVLAFEEVVQGRASRQSSVSKLAVFDDGIGMSNEVMELCLGFAQGTRIGERTGIGRFGVGLPLASISQCQKVTVYSWQNGEPPLMTYLDIAEVMENKQNYTNAAVQMKLPEQYTNVLKDVIGPSGTLVIWESCDRMNLKRSSTLLRRMQLGFCRIYRHYLDDNDEYGDRRDMKLLQISGKEVKEHLLVPNDPLYLLKPNNLPGFENRAANERYQDQPIRQSVEYAPGKFDEIEIHGSHIRQNPGRWKNGSAQMNHYRKNTGISFVREGREIDFGSFGYFNEAELTERYWGIEIHFSPKLDELFGVTNNKQAVRGVEFLGKEEEEDYNDEYINSDLFLKFRIQLSRNISQLRRQLTKEVANRSTTTPWSEGEVNEIVELPAAEESETATDAISNSRTPTGTKEAAAEKTEVQKDKEVEEVITASNPNLTPNEIAAAVRAFRNLGLSISYDAWPGEQFLSVKGVGDTCVAQINRDHPFFTILYDEICGGKDTTTAHAMNLLLMAYARAEDEMYNDSDVLERFRSVWGGWVRTFLKKLKET